MPSPIILPSNNPTDEQGHPMERGPLECLAHPVTKVYCDEFGFVWFERDGAEPFFYGSDAKSSRMDAGRIVWGMVRDIQNKPIYETKICSTGIGLTFHELYDQTARAMLISREKAGRHYDKVIALHHKEGDWGFRKKTGAEI